MSKQLHWTQRVALVRHNLHAASRSGDFTFFKVLQAARFMEGNNHVATLSASLGDDADVVLAALDNLNAGLAYVHQDAFKNTYENLKNSMREENKTEDKSKLYVDMTMQKNVADMAIDKTAGSVIALINQQPPNVQDEVASVWITGASIVSDCMEISLKHMEGLEQTMDDFIRMEESWNTVKASVICAITGLKGVFNLMDQDSPQDSSRASRATSIASASAGMFRRLSNAFVTTPSTTSGSRSGSVASQGQSLHSRQGSAAAPVYRTPNYVRNSVSAGCPTSLPSINPFEHANHKLSMIPPTPAAHDEQADPFDTSVPPVPALPALPNLPVQISESGRMGQAVMCLL